MSFQNNPRDVNNEGKIKRYVHQTLTIDHFGTHAKILENGKVFISKVADDQSEAVDEIEYDEITISASLIFKLAGLLKATRTIQYVDVGSNHGRDDSEKNEETEKN